MPCEFTLSRRVEFAETDMAGIVHFANFFRMMENTEHAFFRSLGLSIQGREGDAWTGWPRVSAACDYLKPLRFEEMVDVQLLVAEVRARSIRYVFRFWKTEDGQRVEIARGRLAAVFATMDKATGKFAAASIPETIRAAVTAAPEEMLGDSSRTGSTKR